jgi:hypothetical protein
MDIRLGMKVRDVVTGFEGIVIARCEYLNGCLQYGVAPKQKKGETTMPDSIYIDFQRLEVVGDGVAPKDSRTGGTQRDAPRGGARSV